MKIIKKAIKRGRIEVLKLQEPFTFNGNLIREARIEIDHVNFGIDRKTGSLNLRKRTNFKASDIEKFLMMLDEETILPTKYGKSFERFEVRIDCPLPGRYLTKTFLMVFELMDRSPGVIFTVTLFRIGA